MHFRALGYRFTGDPLEFVGSESEKIVFLSIDDNFRTSFDLLDLCDDLEIRFAVYLNSMRFREDDSPPECVDADSAYRDNLRSSVDLPVLSKKEIKAIFARGHTVGAHSHSHRCLTKLSPADAEDEIRVNKSMLEEIVEDEVKHFSYPFGMRRHFNESLRDYCRRVGFQTVAGAIPGMQHARQLPYEIHRSGWQLGQTLQRNVESLRIDGRLFERLTGRSAVG